MTVDEAKNIYFYYLGKIHMRDLGSTLYNEYHNLHLSNNLVAEWHQELLQIKKDALYIDTEKNFDYKYMEALLVCQTIDEYISCVNLCSELLQINFEKYESVFVMSVAISPSEISMLFEEKKTVFDYDNKADITVLPLLGKILFIHDEKTYFQRYKRLCIENNVIIPDELLKKYE